MSRKSTKKLDTPQPQSIVQSNCGIPGDSHDSPLEHSSAPAGDQSQFQVSSDLTQSEIVNSVSVGVPLQTAPQIAPDIPLPMSPKQRRLTDMALVTELVVGTPIEVIAKNYRLDIKYVERIRLEWMSACKIQESFDYRHDIKVRAIEAVRAGLDDSFDNYKRASIGVRALQGIGEFKPDQVAVNILQTFANVPAEMRHRYISNESEPVEVPASDVRQINNED